MVRVGTSQDADLLEGGRVSGHIALSLATLGMPPGRSPSRHSGLWRSCPTGSGLGIGSALVRAGLDACRRLGHEVVVLLGHPAF